MYDNFIASIQIKNAQVPFFVNVKSNRTRTKRTNCVVCMNSLRLSLLFLPSVSSVIEEHKKLQVVMEESNQECEQLRRSATPR